MVQYTFRMFVAVLTFAAVTIASPDPEQRGHKALNLTDAQKEQFEKISFDTKKKQIEIKAKLESAQLDARRLMKMESVDKSAVEKKWSEIATLHVALKMNHLNAWLEKNKILTPEQQKTWKDMRGRDGHGKRNQFKRRGMPMKAPLGPMMEHRIERKIEREPKP